MQKWKLYRIKRIRLEVNFSVRKYWNYAVLKLTLVVDIGAVEPIFTSAYVVVNLSLMMLRLLCLANLKMLELIEKEK